MSGAKARLQTDLLAMVDDPLGASVQVGAMLRLGRNARETQILRQLGDRAGFVLLQVIEDFLHREFLAGSSGGGNNFKL